MSITVQNVRGASVAVLEDATTVTIPSARVSVVTVGVQGPAGGAVIDGSSTTFNADGTITTEHGQPLGVASVTTFNPDGSITEVFAAPVSKTRVTTFNDDGSITTEVS
jgi:hypothetical protein